MEFDYNYSIPAYSVRRSSSRIRQLGEELEEEDSSLSTVTGLTLTRPFDPTYLLASLDSRFQLDSHLLRLDRIIGRGAFGIVYSGEYQNQPVAIKIVKATTTGNNNNNNIIDNQQRNNRTKQCSTNMDNDRIESNSYASTSIASADTTTPTPTSDSSAYDFSCSIADSALVRSLPVHVQPLQQLIQEVLILQYLNHLSLPTTTTTSTTPTPSSSSSNRILELIGWTRSKDTIMMVTRLYEGGSVEARFIRDGVQSTIPRTPSSPVLSFSPPLFARLRILLDAARGLSQVHDARLIHNDIAARNLLLDRDGTTCVIADFGLAAFREEEVGKDDHQEDDTNSKLMNEDQLQRDIPIKRTESEPNHPSNDTTLSSIRLLRQLSRSRSLSSTSNGGSGVGPCELISVRHAAPESLRGCVRSFPSDIWSWSVTAYEILTSSVPYADLANFQVAWSVVEMGRRLTLNTKECSSIYVNNLLQACWKQPNQRPTAREIVNAIEHLLRDTSEHTPIMTPAQPNLTTSIVHPSASSDYDRPLTPDSFSSTLIDDTYMQCDPLYVPIVASPPPPPPAAAPAMVTPTQPTPPKGFVDITDFPKPHAPITATHADTTRTIVEEKKKASPLVAQPIAQLTAVDARRMLLEEQRRAEAQRQIDAYSECMSATHSMSYESSDYDDRLRAKFAAMAAAEEEADRMVCMAAPPLTQQITPPMSTPIAPPPPPQQPQPMPQQGTMMGHTLPFMQMLAPAPAPVTSSAPSRPAPPPSAGAPPMPLSASISSVLAQPSPSPHLSLSRVSSSDSSSMFDTSNVSVVMTPKDEQPFWSVFDESMIEEDATIEATGAPLELSDDDEDAFAVSPAAEEEERANNEYADDGGVGVAVDALSLASPDVTSSSSLSASSSQSLDSLAMRSNLLEQSTRQFQTATPKKGVIGGIKSYITNLFASKERGTPTAALALSTAPSTGSGWSSMPRAASSSVAVESESRDRSRRSAVASKSKSKSTRSTPPSASASNTRSGPFDGALLSRALPSSSRGGGGGRGDRTITDLKPSASSTPSRSASKSAQVDQGRLTRDVKAAPPVSAAAAQPARKGSIVPPARAARKKRSSSTATPPVATPIAVPMIPFSSLADVHLFNRDVLACRLEGRTVLGRIIHNRTDFDQLVRIVSDTNTLDDFLPIAAFVTPSPSTYDCGVILIDRAVLEESIDDDSQGGVGRTQPRTLAHQLEHFDHPHERIDAVIQAIEQHARGMVRINQLGMRCGPTSAGIRQIPAQRVDNQIRVQLAISPLLLLHSHHTHLFDSNLSSAALSARIEESGARYLAPELIRGSGPSELSEVYTWAVTAWEAIHRREAYDDHQPTHINSLLMSIARGDLRLSIDRTDSNVISSSYPNELLNLIDECLQHDTNRRPNLKQLHERISNIERERQR